MQQPILIIDFTKREVRVDWSGHAVSSPASNATRIVWTPKP